MRQSKGDEFRYLGVVMSAIKTFVPSDYQVTVHPEATEMPDCGAHYVQFFAHAIDVDPWTQKELVIPAPLTPLCLFIAMHEIGHIACRHGVRWYKGMEFEASIWARKMIESKGIIVPQDVLDRAKEANTKVERQEEEDRVFASFRTIG